MQSLGGLGNYLSCGLNQAQPRLVRQMLHICVPCKLFNSSLPSNRENCHVAWFSPSFGSPGIHQLSETESIGVSVAGANSDTTQYRRKNGLVCQVSTSRVSITSLDTDKSDDMEEWKPAKVVLWQSFNINCLHHYCLVVYV